MRRLVLLLCTALTCCTAAGSAPRVAEPALLREGGLSGLPRGTGTTLRRGVHEVGFPPGGFADFSPPLVSRCHPGRAAGGQAGACAGGEGAGEVPSPLLAPRRRGRLRARRGPPPAVGGLQVQRHG